MVSGEQTIPIIWTRWDRFFGAQSYWAVMILCTVVLGPIMVSMQLYRSRSATMVSLGAAFAGALWILSLAIPIAIPYSVNPYVSTRPGVYLALTGAVLVGAMAISLWRGSQTVGTS